MFENVALAPADPILGLNEAFKADKRPEKINLTVGVYQDESGMIPQLNCISTAEGRLGEHPDSPSYLPIDGDPTYTRAAAELMFGESDPHLTESRIVSAQTPGGTGGLRVVGDLLKKLGSVKTIWHSDPTWANHKGIFAAAGIETQAYDYLDDKRTGLDFSRMIQSVSKIPTGDAVLLHGCCHNPTGVDPTAAQWEDLIQIIAERQLLPVIDCAYQGFGEGLAEDAFAARRISQQISELLVVQSFSKNFSLYNQRVGVVHVLTATSDAANAVKSQLKNCIRVNYSNPPQHGAALVRIVLNDDQLRQQWEGEVADMRSRIATLRNQFASQLAAKCSRDFSHVATQRGMFSFSGIQPAEVERLREEFAIYMVGNGRMNVAGLSNSNLDRTTDAIATVVG